MTEKHPSDVAVAPALSSSALAMPIRAYLAEHHPAVTNPMASAAVFYHPGAQQHDEESGPEGGERVLSGAGQGVAGLKGSSGSSTRLLLVRRAPTDFLPLRWEVPGGSADFERGSGEGGEGEGKWDGSLIETAVRELWEEVSCSLCGPRTRWRRAVLELYPQARDEHCDVLDALHSNVHLQWRTILRLLLRKSDEEERTNQRS